MQALSPRDHLRKIIARTSRVINLRNLELIACLGPSSLRIFDVLARNIPERQRRAARDTAAGDSCRP